MSDDAIEPPGTWLRTAATLLACVSIVLVLVNAALVLRNQRAQSDINQRQQVINQAAQLGRIGQLLVQTIGRIAVTSRDDALSAALERHGIRIEQNPAPDAGSAPAGSKP